jgi:hypothetical protein
MIFFINNAWTKFGPIFRSSCAGSSVIDVSYVLIVRAGPLDLNIEGRKIAVQGTGKILCPNRTLIFIWAPPNYSLSYVDFILYRFK